jgi:ribonuclease BN (tRNA processing enzyme)
MIAIDQINKDENVTLTVIGSGDAFGSGGRLNTCFHVQIADYQLLIDCGATTVSGLKKQGFRVGDIDAILITHFHGDHYGGLPFFLLDYARQKHAKPLTIISPPECKLRVQSLLDLLYPGSLQLDGLAVDFIEYQAFEVVKTDHLIVQTYPVVHVEAALPNALRIKIGKHIISYTGDTEWTPVLVDVAKDADLFICQCNYYEKDSKGHLNYQTLQKHLPELSCKKIWLTHFDVDMLEHMDKVELECAEDGKQTTL